MWTTMLISEYYYKSLDYPSGTNYNIYKKRYSGKLGYVDKLMSNGVIVGSAYMDHKSKSIELNIPEKYADKLLPLLESVARKSNYTIKYQ
jgi:uncharacterized protein YkvS